MTGVQTSAEQSGATSGQDQYPAGALVVVRDEEWLVRSSMPTSDEGTRIEVTGVSEFVRDQEAVFFSGLDRIELLDPGATTSVVDDSPNYRRSRCSWRRCCAAPRCPSRNTAWRSPTRS